ncbi:antifreeze protein Maxi-like [Schistocerca cancellata]|uniref:antifreeze protein Maxi-like n=1 Tax=Schistocerca cancellata TaxID=274614 RepID=UPI00211808E9|nr:antifreeze protein Maxi-like [Schistocerca cancellata]
MAIIVVTSRSANSLLSAAPAAATRPHSSGAAAAAAAAAASARSPVEAGGAGVATEEAEGPLRFSTPAEAGGPACDSTPCLSLFTNSYCRGQSAAAAAPAATAAAAAAAAAAERGSGRPRRDSPKAAAAAAAAAARTRRVQSRPLHSPAASSAPHTVSSSAHPPTVHFNLTTVFTLLSIGAATGPRVWVTSRGAAPPEEGPSRGARRRPPSIVLRFQRASPAAERAGSGGAPGRTAWIAPPATVSSIVRSVAIVTTPKFGLPPKAF